jgi:hypothetical protein
MGSEEHDEYVRNLESLVKARTEQLREALIRVESLTRELENLRRTKFEEPPPEG